MLKALFTLVAVVDGLFGIALLIAPADLLSIYGMATDRAGTFLGHFLGGTLIGFALLSWFARNWSDTNDRRLLVRVLFVTTTLGFLASLDYQLQPGAPLPAVAFVGLTLVFAISFAYGTFRDVQAARRA